MKMRRWLSVLVGFFALLVIALVAVVVYIDAIAGHAVERGATHALGVNTTVGSMHVGLLSGEANLGKLKVANPQGFTSDHFLTLGKGDLAVTLGSLTKDTVVVPSLRLEGIDMNLEKRGGKANYDVILGNLKHGESTPPPEPQQKPGKKFVVNELVILDTAVHTDLVGLGGKLTQIDVKIPEIRLKGVGSDTKGGVLLSELSGVITKAVMDAVARKAGLPPEIAGEITGGLAQLNDLGQHGVEVVGGVQKSVEGVFQDVGKILEGEGTDRPIHDIQETTKGAAKEVGGFLKGVGEAVKGKKEE